MKSGSIVFCEGNSFLAQLMYAIICESSFEDVWTLGGNSLLAYSRKNAILVFIIDNDQRWQGMDDPYNIINFLKKIQFVPDQIILGYNNYMNQGLNKRRVDIYMKEFPTISITNLLDYHLPGNCHADFKNCAVGNGHQCLPGPLFRNAEDLACSMINASKLV